MYLKKLEMIGFKSFAESMEVAFEPGITGIVGPNGCGKSNIVDAILWVLGEQSTKALRSDRMEDVIFNGSESRRPLNLCEVILTVGGVTGEVAGQFGEFHEIAISRRLFRTGESEYLINKIPCRLKDIRDLLIDTGAGHKGHTIIEQGKVDQLLNASPLERRELIEETAGISKYKLRRVEAERKLDATQQNLLRVRDIIGEVKRQTNALDRQVKKTELYRSLESEARGLALNLLISEFKSHSKALSEVQSERTDLQSKESALRAELSRLDSETETIRAAALQKESALTVLKQTAYETQTLIHRQENRIELLQSQIHTWEEQRFKLIQDQARIEQAIKESIAQSEDVARQRDEAATTLGDRRGRLTERETALAEADAHLSAQDRAIEENKNRMFESMAALTEVKNQSASLESRKKEILRIQDKSRAEISSVDQQRDQSRGLLKIEGTRMAELSDRFAHIEADRVRLAEILSQKKSTLEALTERGLRLRESQNLVQARLASLRENEKVLTTTQSGIRELFLERPEIRTRLGELVADLLEVPKAYETAIESVLGDQLQGLLIDDHDTMKEIVTQLKSSHRGRGLFLPRTPRTETRPDFPDPAADSTVVGPALEKVTVKSGFEAVARILLGHVLLVQNLEAALRLWNRGPAQYTIVTLDGEVLSPSGLLWGGRRTESEHGLLQTRREARELEAELAGIESDLGRTENEKAGVVSELERLSQEESERAEQRQRLDSDLAAQRQKIALLEADLARFTERHALLQTELAHETQEAGTVDQYLAETFRRLEERRGEQEQIEGALGRLQETIKDLSEKREAFRAEVTQLKVDISALIQREESMERESSRLRDEQTSLEEQRQRQATEAANLEAKVLSVRQDIRETETALTALSAELSENQRRVSAEAESYNIDLGEVKRLEELAGRTRSELNRVEKLHNELEVRQAELKLRIEHLTEQASTQYRTELETASAAATEEVDIVQTQERLNELRNRLEQLGPVNLAAIDEYKEMEERHRFLTDQDADLTKSIQDLQSAISKISRTTREMFLSTYTTLREKFKEVFQNFFVGGQADLILLDETNPLDSGIEIVAQPPGKRLKSITLLSGGEKALTAIALLFSSFLIHPSPFCVLDEIDAPLDEENIRRFLKVLRQMTDHSQFLIVTHNKRTMEHADILYGVTMQEAGVSKLVSVKLGSNGNGHSGTGAKMRAANSSTSATV